MENKKKKIGWFWSEAGHTLWQHAVLRYVDYVNVFRHLGLSPAALCAATLWGGAMALATPSESRHWDPLSYFKIAGLLCIVSAGWNLGKALWFSDCMAKTFWSGMSEFFGLLLVAGTRQPVSFLLAGNATAWKSPIYPWIIGYFSLIVILNLCRQWVKRRRELARKRAESGSGDPCR